MTDQPHTHLEHGLRDGCPACDQTRAQLSQLRPTAIAVPAGQRQPQLASR